jgi:hypothetical protein
MVGLYNKALLWRWVVNCLQFWAVHLAVWGIGMHGYGYGLGLGYGYGLDKAVTHLQAAQDGIFKQHSRVQES